VAVVSPTARCLSEGLPAHDDGAVESCKHPQNLAPEAEPRLTKMTWQLTVRRARFGVELLRGGAGFV